MTAAELSTLEAIRIWGGSFMKHIGAAYMAADEQNRQKIRETWPREWAQYVEQGERLREQERAQEAAIAAAPVREEWR